MTDSLRVVGTPAHPGVAPNASNQSLAIRPANLGDRSLPSSTKRSTGPQQTIDNPLLTFDDTIAQPHTERTELEDYVLEFARNADLEDRYELLMFGARLARDPHEALSRYEHELTSPEKELIKNEKKKSTGFWQQSKFFRATIMTASLAGMIQGWTQSTNNGTIVGMPEEFGLCITPGSSASCPKNASNTQDLWIFGMLNAIPMLTAGLFGTTLADPLQENYLGRRGSVLVSALITLASTIGASTTHSVGQLAACRAINGVALGAKASIVPIYSAEISPEHIRGAILANWQLADAAGIFFGFLVNLIVVIYVRDSHRSWRIMTNTVLIPTIPLLIMIYLMPESPRYLMKHGRYRKALESFEMIQTTRLLAARDFMYAHAQLDFESRLMKGVANEQGNLADRITRSHRKSAADTLGDTNGTAHRRRDRSSLSLSPTQSINMAESEQNHNGQRGSHQQPSTLGLGGLNRNVELSDLGRRDSDLSSLEAELAVRRVRRHQENPYFYHIGVTGYFKRLAQLWTNKRCRRALQTACIAMLSQQLTGVNTIAFLGTTVWENSLGNTNDHKASAIIGVFFGAANYIGGLPAYWLSDKYGRSIMLALGLPNMAWSMLIFAFVFKIQNDKARLPLVSIFAVIFTLFYAPTAGTSPFSISAEVFPLVSREVGMAVSVAVNLLGTGILILVFPMLMHRIGITGSLSIFAGLNVVAFFLVFLFVRETRKRTLEELQYTFDLPTRLHVEYRTVYIRKYVTKNFWKFVTRQTVRPPVPFYRWARSTHSEIARSG